MTTKKQAQADRQAVKMFLSHVGTKGGQAGKGHHHPTSEQMRARKEKQEQRLAAATKDANEAVLAGVLDPADAEAYAKTAAEKAVADLTKAYTKFKKADTDQKIARAIRAKAVADVDKARFAIAAIRAKDKRGVYEPPE